MDFESLTIQTNPEQIFGYCSLPLRGCLNYMVLELPRRLLKLQDTVAYAFHQVMVRMRAASSSEIIFSTNQLQYNSEGWEKRGAMQSILMGLEVPPKPKSNLNKQI
jgi:hypothetical protein